MKKFMKPVLMVVLSAFLLVSMFSCYGNFALTRMVYEWNGQVTGNKFINSIVFWVLNWIPVYSIAAGVDVIILNTIEFWTGSNPVAMADGEESIQYTELDGTKYELKMTNDAISITGIEGENLGALADLRFDEAPNSLHLQQDGASTKIATMNGDTMDLIYPSGNVLTVSY